MVELQPILITKNFILNKKNQSETLLTLAFNKEKTINQKLLTDQYYLTIKQKRYKRKKNIPFRTRVHKTYDGKNLAKDIKFEQRPYLSATRILSSINYDLTKLYRAMRKNKIRHETISVQFARRLLRTKKTLVLPAHVNLTVVSNSYDVVHS